jgi:hypothetical protein
MFSIEGLMRIDVPGKTLIEQLTTRAKRIGARAEAEVRSAQMVAEQRTKNPPSLDADLDFSDRRLQYDHAQHAKMTLEATEEVAEWLRFLAAHIDSVKVYNLTVRELASLVGPTSGPASLSMVGGLF